MKEQHSIPRKTIRDLAEEISHIFADWQAREHGQAVAAGKARARQRRVEQGITEVTKQSASKDGTP